MKRYFILAILFSIVVSMFFANETIEGFTLGGGKVILRNDGTWEWSEKPEKYKDFNVVTPVSKPNIRVWSFNYNSFFRNPYGCTGKYYRINGIVSFITKDTAGNFIKLYTKGDLFDPDREVFITGYDDFDLHVGDKVELTAKFNSLSEQTKLNGDKYQVPLFVWTEDSTIYLK